MLSVQSIITAFTLLLSFSNAIGQTISLSQEELQVWSVPQENESWISQAGVDITNTGQDTIEIKVRREVICESPDSENRLGWGGLVYSFSTDESLLSYVVNPSDTVFFNQMDDGFTAYYNSNEVTSLTKLKYTFFEVDNEANQANLEVSFCFGDNEFCSGQETACITSIGELEEQNNMVIYPNPAESHVQLEGAVNLNGVMRLTLFNLQREEIKAWKNEIQGKLDVSDLTVGAYFIHVLRKDGSNQMLKLMKD